MLKRSLFIAVIAVTSLFIFGCGGPAANSNNTAAANSNNPLETTKKTPEATTNNAPTLTPVFKAYCDAWVKNDEAALRKVYSAATLKQFETEMKEEKAKSLIKFLEPTDKVSGNPCEVTNETINGDKAVARIKSDKYPNGIEIEFVRENGEWKMTNRSPAVDSVKRSAPGNTSAGKPANPPGADTVPKNK